jgi:DNA-binding CsgD family transcriptional regulator
MDFGIAEPQFLSADATRAFGLIAAGENVPAALQHAVPELMARGVVVEDIDHPGQLVALNPREVAERNMDALLAEATTRVAEMKSLRPITEQLAEQYDRAQWRTSSGSEYIDDVAVVNARLDDVVGAAQVEILAAQPFGPRTEEQLARSIARDTAALDRGVAKRTLYRASVRDTAVTASYARQMSTRTSGRPAEFKTLPEPFERLIVVDRKVAFISNHLVEGAPEHSAWQITDRAFVAYIVAEFEEKWRRANPWQGELRGRGLTIETVSSPVGVRSSRRQREIMRDMVEGRDQRAIAARLGISLRTVVEEIAALKDLFGAQSREQLSFKWAWSPDRLVDDSAPEAGPSGAGSAA